MYLLCIPIKEFCTEFLGMALHNKTGGSFLRREDEK